MGNGFKLSYRCILCTIYIDYLLEIGKVARVGRVVLIVGAFLWKMGSKFNRY